MTKSFATRVRTFLAIALASLAVPACAMEEEPEADESADALQSTPLTQNLMRPYPTPAGMPKPWDQPDSTGWFGERGKCGPTAVANLLKLYSVDVSPKQADEDGVHWWVGTRGLTIENYFEEHYPELGCHLEHPKDGPAFLRQKLGSGHPVMVWFNTAGTLQSHWVTAVGIVGKGAQEHVIVMSWGRYYSIPMQSLDDAWRNVYWIRRPSIVCDDATKLMQAQK